MQSGIPRVSEAVQRFAFDPLLAAFAFAFAIASASALLFLFDRWGGYFGNVVSPASHKLAALEGLRGVLAFSVVMHHAYCWYFFTQYGVWTTGNSVIFARLADFGVIQFFYLSGFLFWRKLMKTGRIPVAKFYLSRFVRIGPVYYFCVGAAIFLGFSLTGLKLQVSIETLASSLLPWFLFSLGGQTEVNHADIARITCGVTWTLALEWLFYLSLPFLGWFSRNARRLLHYALAFGLLFLLGRYFRAGSANEGLLHSASSILAEYSKFMLVGFGGGILIAALEPQLRSRLQRLLPWRNWILLGLYLAYLLVPGIATAGQALVLAGFALVAQGADLFGLLGSRAIRLLGVFSYPMYLVHGIVYYSAMRLRGGIHAVSLRAYLGETAVCVAIIVLLAAIIHLLLERPTMRLSERIARRALVPQAIEPEQGLAQDSSSR
jgi:peptidoglycan/LPS O-acetylase OafA/YrhL